MAKAGSIGDPLNLFLAPVAAWFRGCFGEPTPPQRQGWPAIVAGENTLLFAPTGSGKTLAAFLAGLDHLWRNPITRPTTRILYISPLKALNTDIARNLQEPLEGILTVAEESGFPLRPLTVGIRTGDTPQAERARMRRRPPDILITTPESLHLLLTSGARENLGMLDFVIVDEIHALCPNKRGVFLAILLERLQARNPAGFVRIGLSATQRPLEEVARYLGGRSIETAADGSTRLVPRPVTIVDAGRRKELELEVCLAGGGVAPQGSIWPAIEDDLLASIRANRSTIIFANNRRIVERLTSRLNEKAELDRKPGDDGDCPPLVRAHHGSLNLDERRRTEDALKRGELAAVVSTASLEMGIDMGAVDLVCQVESPGGIARGLQRVGRAGHVVGRKSRGRMLAKTSGDLLETAALARAMIAGQVEALRVPTNCLDVLAQQVVACVGMDRWEVPALFDLMRCAYPYRDLTADAFEAVLAMVSGRFPAASLRDLRPRLSWDRVHNALAPLPGTQRMALVGGGTIPDSGQYPLYLGENGPKLGELDEEFVLERRVGETFVLGTSTWKIDAIEPQKVVVSPAEGRSALMPFWRGEGATRSAELGEAVGELTREIRGRLGEPSLLEWLERECRLDAASAKRLRDYVGRQVRHAGAAPDDRTVLVEAFDDPTGELGLAILTPFGGKLHNALKLAIQERLRERYGIEAACLSADDGVLIRLPRMDDPPLDILEGLDGALAERLIRDSLGDSPLFGLRFRQNAGRALLMPRPDPSKRTPLWLQRLRAKDLLQVVRKSPVFPIVVETYRECIDDDLDLPRLRTFLDKLATGEIEVVGRRNEIPSPFTSELTFQFTLKFMYEWDEPKRLDRGTSARAVDEGLLDPLLASASTDPNWLDPAAVGRVEGRLRGAGRPPRSVEEMAETLRRLGDLDDDEVVGPMAGFLRELADDHRACRIDLEGTTRPGRWIHAEDLATFDLAFADPPDEVALATVLGRYMRTRALVGLADLTSRYPVEAAIATELLERRAHAEDFVRVDDPEGVRWADRRNLEEARRITIALRRKEALAVAPEVFAAFVLARQHVAAEAPLRGEAALTAILDQLRGRPLPAEVWESDVLPRRLGDYRPAWLDSALTSGGWTWRAEAPDARADPSVSILPRDFPGAWTVPESAEPLAGDPASILATLGTLGASFVTDIARSAGMEPSRIRSSLATLVARGLVTNDRFDPVRPNSRARAEALVEARATSRPRGLPRRPVTDRPEGRWSLVTSTGADAEGSALAWAAAVLDRYGVLCRETAAVEPWCPPWRELFPFLDRAEMRGELRRGHFVEGLSGVQFAEAETIDALARFASSGTPVSPILLPTLDPANLYGSGAPLDVPLLEGGTARLFRNASNWIVLIGGRPILIVEGMGKRLTGLGAASEAELKAAIGLLPSLATSSRRVLKVETYNGAATLASPAAPWLAEAGFVRDYPGMAYYAGF
jgi:ATP-dependent Lhr-like helicase